MYGIHNSPVRNCLARSRRRPHRRLLRAQRPTRHIDTSDAGPKEAQEPPKNEFCKPIRCRSASRPLRAVLPTRSTSVVVVVCTIIQHPTSTRPSLVKRSLKRKNAAPLAPPTLVLSSNLHTRIIRRPRPRIQRLRINMLLRHLSTTNRIFSLTRSPSDALDMRRRLRVPLHAPHHRRGSTHQSQNPPIPR